MSKQHRTITLPIRCVRRAYLCGNDPYSGKYYEHRRQRIFDKIKQLSGIFAIDICAYAALSNHYHVVLHVNEVQANSWDTKEITERWYSLFKANFLVDKYRSGEGLSQAEFKVISDFVTQLQKRLRNYLGVQKLHQKLEKLSLQKFSL